MSSSADYLSLLTELHREGATQGQPLSGTFELTERCNLACRMCYIRRACSSTAKLNQELCPRDWVDLTAKAVDAGMVFLLLTGGEVFLRDDFLDIYDSIAGLGIELTIFTNGTLMSDTTAARLAETPPGRLEVTMYGATARTYENITGVPGSYYQCRAGIDTLMRHGLPLALKATVTRQNIHELDEMRRMANAWKLPFTASWLLCKRRDCADSEVNDCRLPASDCVALERTDPTSVNEQEQAARRDLADCSEDSLHCQAGRTSFVIDPSGAMGACVNLPLPRARPLDIGFGPAWSQVKEFVASLPKISSSCQHCGVRKHCPRCAAWSYLETGTYNEPVPYLCQIARERSKVYSS